MEWKKVRSEMKGFIDMSNSPLDHCFRPLRLLLIIIILHGYRLGSGEGMGKGLALVSFL